MRLLPVLGITLTVVLLLRGEANAGTLDGIRAQFDAETIGWTSRALAVARDIFVAIVGTELVWSLIEIFLGTRELESFVSSITRRIIWVGAAITLFTVAPAAINDVLFDFSNIGAYITGFTFGQTNPDTVLQYGASIATALNPPYTANVPLFFLAFI